jgi:AcrR family transcriptional regulator
MKAKETGVPKASAKARPRNDTRLRLIIAAEKLFGEKGIHGVTLKEINAAAGQRNESALHYHFGSKAALVEAILLFRATHIDAVRHERMEAMISAGEEKNVRAILRATFLPMTELLDQEDGVRFVRFLAQVLNDPDHDLPSLLTRGNKLPGVAKANALLFAALSGHPPEIARQRQRFLVEMMVNALAMWTRHHDPMDEAPARDFFVAGLFDSVEGFLTAPVSDETLDLLKKSQRKKEKK